ncbi:MAG: cell division protein ZapA [Rhodoferax sp.]|jgi:cell division protein ZapA|nr:cell division protein ZapA [Rhodoferax sp.]
MKQLEVNIMGQSYLLSCPEGGDARLLDAAQRVNDVMCSIRDSGKVRARDRIAVLAAINLAFDERAQAADQAALSGNSTPTASDSAAAQKLAALLTRLDNALNRDDQLV